MSMFDWVNHQMNCPKCGQLVKGFQSKDGACNMDRVEYWEVDEFHTFCSNCNTWIEYRRKKPKNFVPLDDYELSYYKIGESNV